MAKYLLNTISLEGVGTKCGKHVADQDTPHQACCFATAQIEFRIFDKSSDEAKGLVSAFTPVPCLPSILLSEITA
jgi:hypothetical protein